MRIVYEAGEFRVINDWKKDLKDMLLVLSVLMPVVFGFIFTCQLLEKGKWFLIYWGIVYGWIALFTYANCRKRPGKKGKK